MQLHGCLQRLDRVNSACVIVLDDPHVMFRKMTALCCRRDGLFTPRCNRLHNLPMNRRMRGRKKREVCLIGFCDWLQMRQGNVLAGFVIYRKTGLHPVVVDLFCTF